MPRYFFKSKKVVKLAVLFFFQKYHAYAKYK